MVLGKTLRLCKTTQTVPIKFSTYCLLFIPFFLLFYAEPVQVGSIPVSQIWKLPLAVYMLYYVFQYRSKPTPLWTQTTYWISFKSLFNAGTVTDLMTNVQASLKFLFLPLIYSFASSKAMSRETLVTVLLLLSHYFVLTNIPIFLGLPMLSSGHDYGTYVAYSGIFQNQHAMSVIMGICIAIILHFFKAGRFKSRGAKVYNIVLLAIAAYAMYRGFARTGWLMCLLSVFVLFWPKDATVRQWLGIITMTAVLAGGFTIMMLTNELFRDRVLGNNIQTHEKMNIDSGRSEYTAAAFERYCIGTPLEQIIGMSTQDEMDYIQLKTRNRVGAHNGFMDMLARNGIIGITLMFLMLFTLLFFIYRRRDCPTYRLALALWLMNFSFQVTQGGSMFHTDLLYALVFCLLEEEYELPTQSALTR